MSWKQAGIIAAALVAFIALASFAKPFVDSDSPPWANVDRVKDTGNRVEARIVRGNILGMWRSKCESARGGNIGLAIVIDGQISELQDDYIRLTGLPYPLQACP